MILNCFIYLVKCGNYYKIGLTKNIKSRIKSLQTGASQKLQLIDFFETSQPQKDEKLLHDFLSRFHSTGEWFALPWYIVESRSEWFFSCDERLSIRLMPIAPVPKPKEPLFHEKLIKAYEEGNADIGVEILLRGQINQYHARRVFYLKMINDQELEISAKHGISIHELETDRYRGLYGKTTTQLRQEGGVKPSETPLNVMSVRDLTMNSLVNQLVAESGDLSLTFEFGHNLRQTFEKTMKKELTPKWEENQLRPAQARKVLSNGQLEMPLN
jgi:hypothetical protein